MRLTALRPHRIAAAAAPLVIVAASFAVGYAQSPGVTASVDRHKLTTDETVTLSVVIETDTGTGVGVPTLPPLDGLEIIGTSTKARHRTTNGRTTSSVTFNYVLRPLRTGKLTIGPIRVTAPGRANPNPGPVDKGSQMTDPIHLEVEQGTGVAGQSSPGGSGPSVPASDREMFVDAQIDPVEVYLGEQVTYLLRFYRSADPFGRRPRHQVSYDEPAFNGFWSNEDSDQSRYETMVDGNRFSVTEVRTVLFPAVTGPLTVGPATLTVPGGFFLHDTALRSEPVTVNVLPLPGRAPTGFNGAVGRFTIEAVANADESRVNEPITLIVTLRGEGNIDALPEPVWPDIPGWRSFEGDTTAVSNVSRGRLSGARTFDRLLVPGEPGDFTIPPIEYVHFDPEAAEYVTVSTEPVAVTVAPGTGPSSGPGAGAGPSGRLELSATDIRHIRPVPDRLAAEEEPLASRAGYWSMWAALLVLLAGGVAWRAQGGRVKARIAGFRSKSPSAAAMGALEEAERRGDDPYGASSRVLLEYMGARLGQPLNGLTHDEVAELLDARGVDAALSDRVVACLSAGEGRFAPRLRSVETAGLMDETRSVIADLESGLAT